MLGISFSTDDAPPKLSCKATAQTDVEAQRLKPSHQQLSRNLKVENTVFTFVVRTPSAQVCDFVLASIVRGKLWVCETRTLRYDTRPVGLLNILDGCGCLLHPRFCALQRR